LSTRSITYAKPALATRRKQFARSARPLAMMGMRLVKKTRASSSATVEPVISALALVTNRAIKY